MEPPARGMGTAGSPRRVGTQQGLPVHLCGDMGSPGPGMAAVQGDRDTEALPLQQECLGGCPWPNWKQLRGIPMEKGLWRST